MEAIKTETINGKTINICLDEYPINPREEMDNFGTMICFHNHYVLGDRKHFKGHDNINPSYYSGFEEMESAIKAIVGDVIILPIYMMNHSGLSISTSSFWFHAVDSKGWDWGQIGFIYASKDDIIKEFGSFDEEKATNVLEAEVEAYNNYLSGESYYYAILENGEIVDSCCGYNDIDDCMEEAIKSIA